LHLFSHAHFKTEKEAAFTTHAAIRNGATATTIVVAGG
jgi:hypothetical protein